MKQGDLSVCLSRTGTLVTDARGASFLSHLLSLTPLGILPPLFGSDVPPFELLETPSCVTVLLPHCVVWLLAV